MDDLYCRVSLLCDITLIVEGPDDSQLVVEWAVGVKTQVLVGVDAFLYTWTFIPPSSFLPRDVSIQKRDAAILSLLVCELVLPVLLILSMVLMILDLWELKLICR